MSQFANAASRAPIGIEDAKRSLVGRDGSVTPEEAAAAIELLAASGHSDAMCTLATLRGAGAWTRHSWAEAIDLLREAAELGSVEARVQLQLLASDRELAVRVRSGAAREPGRWRQLKDSIDLGAWVTPERPPVQVWDAPKIWTVEEFAPPELCEWLVAAGRNRFRRALMFDRTSGVAQALDSRTCSDFFFDVVEGGVVMLLLRIKISNVTTIPVPHMEPPQIFHYAIGEEIKPHHDYLFLGEGYGQEGAYTGDRLATFLLYLNDGYHGGELEFPRVGFRYKGRPGDGIFFASLSGGKQDPLSLHGATPVTRGEKFILSQWIHNQPFTA